MGERKAITAEEKEARRAEWLKGFRAGKHQAALWMKSLITDMENE